MHLQRGPCQCDCQARAGHTSTVRDAGRFRSRKPVTGKDEAGIYGEATSRALGCSDCLCPSARDVIHITFGRCSLESSSIPLPLHGPVIPEAVTSVLLESNVASILGDGGTGLGRAASVGSCCGPRASCGVVLEGGASPTPCPNGPALPPSPPPPLEPCSTLLRVLPSCIPCIAPSWGLALLVSPAALLHKPTTQLQGPADAHGLCVSSVRVAETWV